MTLDDSLCDFFEGLGRISSPSFDHRNFFDLGMRLVGPQSVSEEKVGAPAECHVALLGFSSLLATTSPATPYARSQRANTPLNSNRDPALRCVWVKCSNWPSRKHDLRHSHRKVTILQETGTRDPVKRASPLHLRTAALRSCVSGRGTHSRMHALVAQWAPNATLCAGQPTASTTGLVRSFALGPSRNALSQRGWTRAARSGRQHSTVNFPHTWAKIG